MHNEYVWGFLSACKFGRYPQQQMKSQVKVLQQGLVSV